ncbi:MAG: hypothetical protein JSR33_07830 [Proteobacteria bacterium]|nr:hypothetical protein [Pseudomonadota bacterium]
MVFLGTQSRILITEWQGLAKIIVAHSVPSQEKVITNIEDLESFDIENLENITFSTGDEIPNILTEKHLNAALQGPYHGFILDKMRAYAYVARFRLELHLQKEEIFKNKRAVLDQSEQIPAKKLTKLTADQLDQMQSDLDQLTEQHDQQWRELINEWSDQLLSYFQQSQVSLTEREINGMKEEDVAAEILPRFIEIGLKLPEKDYSTLSCADYLYLKTLLTLQSALSRQHQVHELKDIEEKIKKYKTVWGEIEKHEKALLSQQLKTTEEVISFLMT